MYKDPQNLPEAIEQYKYTYKKRFKSNPFSMYPNHTGKYIQSCLLILLSIFSANTNAQCPVYGAQSACGTIGAGYVSGSSNLEFCTQTTISITMSSLIQVDTVCIAFGDGRDTLVLNPPLTFTVNHYYNITPVDTCLSPLTLTLNATFIKWCGPNTSHQTISTYPTCNFKPRPRFTVSDLICLGSAVNINPLSPPYACTNASDTANYHWNYGDGSPIVDFWDISSDQYQAPPAHTYASAGTFTITLMADNICGSESYSQQVAVASINSVAYLPNRICTNSIITANISATNGNRFHVNSISGPNGWTIVHNDTIHPQFIFTQSGIYIVDYSILASPNVCDFVDTITVSEGPNIIYQPIPDSCINMVHPLDLSQHYSTSIPGQWDNFIITYNGSTIYTHDSTGIPVTSIYTGNAGLYVISLTYSTPCDTIRRVDSFRVSAPIDSVQLPVTTCAGNMVNATVYPTISSGPDSVSVRPSSGVVITNGQTTSPQFVFSNAGTYSITFYNGACPYDASITVAPGAYLSMISGTTLPSGCAIGQGTFDFADFYTDSNASSQINILTLSQNATTIYYDSTQGIPTTNVNIDSPGIYHIHIIARAGCDTLVIDTSFVITTPTVIPSSSDTICLQTTATLPQAGGAQVLYNGMPYTAGTFYADSPGVYTFVYIPTCGDTAYYTVVAIGTVAYSQPYTACHNVSIITLSGAPPGGVFLGSPYVTGNQMNVGAAGAGIFPYTYIYTTILPGHTCVYTDTSAVTVLDTVNTQHSIPNHGCTGNLITIVNQSGNNLSVNYGDGTGWTAVLTHTYGMAGTYAISLIFSSGACADTTLDSISIYPLPQAAFSMANFNLCNGESHSPSITSTLTAQDSAVWYWRGIAYSTPPVITGDNDTTYITSEWLYLEVYSAYCGNAIDSQIVTMFPRPRPKAGLTYSGHCTPLMVSFANNTIAPPGTSYIWYLNGQLYSTDSLPPPASLTADTVTEIYIFVLAAITHCDTVFDTVSAYVDPPGFRIAIELPYTSACQNTPILFENQMPASYTLTYYPAPGAVFTTHGNDTVSYRYSQPGTYQVMITATNGCGTDTGYETVVILPAPIIAPTYSGGTCQDSLVLFDPGIAAGSIINIVWSFGDGAYDSTDIAPSHIYAASGTYTASVMITGNNGCVSDSSFIVETIRAPRVTFQGDTLLCTSVDISLQAYTNPPTGVVSWFYIRSSGGLDSIESLTPVLHLSDMPSGIYYITVLTSYYNDSSCKSLAGTYKVTVDSTPVANFSVNLLPDLGASFTNQSTGASWIWDFDDSTSSTEKNPPPHYYSDPSKYIITLYALDQSGCEDTARDSLNVLYLCDGSAVYIPNTFTPNGDGKDDIFMIRASTQSNIQISYFKIFDRWGKILFQTVSGKPNDHDFGWDGTDMGKEKLNTGVYVYTYEILCAGNLSHFGKGNVTLLK